MTPEEAEGFREEDEDPETIFARFDGHPVAQIEWGIDYIRRTYGKTGA